MTTVPKLKSLPPMKDVLAVLQHFSAHVPMMLLISLVRGWTTAVETRVALRDFHEWQTEDTLVSEAGFLSLSIIFQVLCLYTNTSLTFYNMVDSADRLPSAEEELPIQINQEISPAPYSKTESRIRFSTYLLLAGLSASVTGPFVYQNGMDSMEKFLPEDMSHALEMGLKTLYGCLSALAIIGSLFTEVRELYHELCVPEAESGHPKFSIPKRLGFMLLRCAIFAIHLLYFFFEASYAYKLDTSESGCPSFGSTKQMALSIYLWAASAALALAMAVFEGAGVENFQVKWLKFWERETRKEQAIALFSILITIGGATAHAFPSIAENNRLMACSSTLKMPVKHTLNATLIGFEAILALMLQLPAVEASTKLLLKPSQIQPLKKLKVTLWGNNTVEPREEDGRTPVQDTDRRDYIHHS